MPELDPAALMAAVERGELDPMSANGPRPELVQRRAQPAWPELDSAALWGLAGEVVAKVDPHTEADPVALLLSYLLGFGNLVGRGPYVPVGGDRHGLNLFVTLVGDTASGRKGTSWGEVRRILKGVNRDYVDTRIRHGLSSGEGVIAAVRDGTSEQDPGEPDKRLLVVESEFARVLQVMKREGNTLSANLRCAWDGGNLESMTKTPMRATGVHVSILAHVTQSELLRHFNEVEAANGFGNRFLWAKVRRSKLLPNGGQLPEEALGSLALDTQRAAEQARKTGPISRTPDADRLWEAHYEDLSTPPPGLFGALTARAAPLVLRLSLLYALLDCASQVDVPHLKAALAMWSYCKDSTRLVFGDALGDPVADRLREMLLEKADAGATRTEIRDHFHRHKTRAELDRALSLLERTGVARKVLCKTGGKAAETWIARV